MCVSSHHFPPDRPIGRPLQTWKTSFLPAAPCPPPPRVIFIPPKPVMDTQGDCVTLMAAEGIISMSKISSPCQTCQLRHTPTHKHTRRLKACWEASATPTSPDMYFVLFLSFPFRVSNGCNGSWGRKKAFVFTRVTAEGPARRSSSLSVRWFTIWLAGPEQALRNGST